MLMPRRPRSRTPESAVADGDSMRKARYVVSFSGGLRVATNKRSPGRAERFAAASAVTSHMTSSLKRLLLNGGFAGEFSNMEPAGALPMIFIECTARVADAIRQMPGVRAVVKDDLEVPLMRPVKRVRISVNRAGARRSIQTARVRRKR